MAEQIKQPDLLQLIRDTLKSQTNKTNKTNKTTTKPTNGKGVQRVKQQPTQAEHGKLGDFTRSNSNAPTRTNNTAIVGYEEVPKTRLSKKDNGNVQAETEMIRKAIKLVLNQTGGAPSKRATKRMAAPKLTKSDRVFQAGKGCGVGSSRSTTLGIIKAIAHPETGCIVREQMKDGKTKEPLKPITEQQSRKNANTTQGNYNPMIVE